MLPFRFCSRSFVPALMALILLFGCGGSDPEPDAWVTVVVPRNSAQTVFDEVALRVDWRKRQIEPKEIICGAKLGQGVWEEPHFALQFDTIYFFRFSAPQARELVASGFYRWRTPSDEDLPYSRMPCWQYGLTPRPG